MTKSLKIWYYNIMENCNEINQKIAKNLIAYRKETGLTQAEVAERINYSDKSVSKWESGNGIPDVYTLMQLAKLYGVTLGELVGEEERKTQKKAKKYTLGKQILIMLLSSGIVWLAAIISFVVLEIAFEGGIWWMTFLYAVAINAIVIVVYSGIWKHRILNFSAVSVLIWSTILCLYLTVREIANAVGHHGNLWWLFLLGVPLQVLEVLWTFFRALIRKQKSVSEEKEANLGTKREE